LSAIYTCPAAAIRRRAIALPAAADYPPYEFIDRNQQPAASTST
jgi:hypothetical protein